MLPGSSQLLQCIGVVVTTEDDRRSSVVHELDLVSATFLRWDNSQQPFTTHHRPLAPTVQFSKYVSYWWHDTAVGENDGYDTILHKISQHNTLWSQNAPPYLTNICCYLHCIHQYAYGHWSEINVAFSLTPLRAFERCRRSWTAFERCRQPLTSFEHRRQDGIKTFQVVIVMSLVNTLTMICIFLLELHTLQLRHSV